MRVARLLLALLIVPLASVPASARASAGERTNIGGASIVWPAAIAKGTVTPGERITVRVSRDPSEDPAVVSLIRIDGSDGVVARASLHRGSFTARVARRAGTRYRLRVAVGSHRSQRWFVVKASMASCFAAEGKAVEGETAGELSLGATSGRAGEPVPATLTNSGETCLTSGLKLQWEALQADGSYAPATPPGPVTLEAYTVPQGETASFLGTVWSNLSPGVYRAALTITVGERVVILTSEPFRVVG